MAKITKKKILILGAGFAGLKVAQDLSKNLSSKSYEIILADRREVHIYTPDLYEIVAAFNKEINQECLTNLTETVATPIRSLIDKEKVRFVHDHIMDIDPKKQVVKFKVEQQIKYDYLVVCLGSETNYFGIPGLKEHAHSVKTITNALALNCHLDMYFQDLWKRKMEQEVNITIGGGGATGVELAGELVNYMFCLSKKYHFKRKDIHIQLVEGSDQLVGFGERGTKIILERFRKKKIKAYLNSRIVAATKNTVTIERNGKKTTGPCDILIWTGGVKTNELIQKTLGEKDHRGAIPVDVNLRSIEYENVFAAGDNAYFVNPKKQRRVPLMAQVAFAQGEVLAQNILNTIQKKTLIPFKEKLEAIIIPIGGKFAICKIGSFIGSGFWCWALRRLVTLKYSWSIMPFRRALNKWLLSHRVFTDND